MAISHLQTPIAILCSQCRHARTMDQCNLTGHINCAVSFTFVKIACILLLKLQAYGPLQQITRLSNLQEKLDIFNVNVHSVNITASDKLTGCVIVFLLILYYIVSGLLALLLLKNKITCLLLQILQ